MGRPRFLQLEMFSLEQNEDKSSSSCFNMKYVKDSERLILTLFSFLLIAIVSYCFGFRQGKKVALLINNDIKQTDKKEITIQSLPLKSNFEEEKTKTPLEKEIKEESKNKANYTIQVATYKTPGYAQREADKLKKNGFTTLIINKGSYVLLCVGSFFNKQEAEIVLAKLKKNYEDCFIRRF